MTTTNKTVEEFRQLMQGVKTRIEQQKTPNEEGANSAIEKTVQYFTQAIQTARQERDKEIVGWIKGMEKQTFEITVEDRTFKFVPFIINKDWDLEDISHEFFSLNPTDRSAIKRILRKHPDLRGVVPNYCKHILFREKNEMEVYMLGYGFFNQFPWPYDPNNPYFVITYANKETE